MTNAHSTDFEEQLNCAFVLSSSLYFGLVAMDPTKRSHRLLGWDGLLHDTTRDLAALSDAVGTADARMHQILSGISDLRHNLRDLADIASRNDQRQLSSDLIQHANRLDAKIARGVE